VAHAFPFHLLLKAFDENNQPRRIKAITKPQTNTTRPKYDQLA
jgi:hypothetical protein